jgi:hypothetical protein
VIDTDFIVFSGVDVKNENYFSATPENVFDEKYTL